MGIFAELGKTFETASTGVISSAVSSIISAITPVVTTGVIVYVMITGYMVIAGRVSEPISDILIKVFKIGLVATLCLSTGGIMEYVVSGVNGMEKMFAQAISGQAGDTFETLDGLFENGIDAATEAAAKAQELDIWSMGTMVGYYITSAICLIALLVCTIIAGALLMLAKVALAIILGLSPFFLAGLMFPATARWADSWFSQALNYIILSAIVIFMMTMITSFFETSIAEIASEVKDGNSFPVEEMGKLIIVSIVNAFVLKQAPSIASGLAGGASMSSASLTGMIAGAKGFSKQTGATAAGKMAGKGAVSAGRGAVNLAARAVGRANSVSK